MPHALLFNDPKVRDWMPKTLLPKNPMLPPMFQSAETGEQKEMASSYNSISKKNK